MAHSFPTRRSSDLQIAQMRRVLDLMAPVSGSEALRSLRDAFPDAPFEESARAVAGA